MIAIISDKKNQEYTDFLAKLLDELSEHEIKGMAVVALCDEYNCTAYWNMGLRDKAAAEQEIRFDTIDEFLLNNRDRYEDVEETGDEEEMDDIESDT